MSATELLREFLRDWAPKLPGCTAHPCKACERREEFLARVRRAVDEPVPYCVSCGQYKRQCEGC